MHMHARAALTLFYKRLFSFNLFFLLNFTFFQNKFQMGDIPSVVVPDLGPFCLREKTPDDTNHLTQPHSMGPIRCVGLLVNTAYPMQSVKTRMRCLSSVAFLKSQNNFRILFVI